MHSILLRRCPCQAAVVCREGPACENHHGRDSDETRALTHKRSAVAAGAGTGRHMAVRIPGVGVRRRPVVEVAGSSRPGREGPLHPDSERRRCGDDSHRWHAPCGG